MTTAPLPDALQTFLKTIPSDPGIYRMQNAEGEVLYVGKAANLKKRVTSYFTKQSTTPKTRSLVAQIQAVDIAVTRSETEALLLESTLIKTLRPKYNVLLRDDKSYPYIHLSDHPDFPSLEAIRCKKKPAKGDFFGPFPSIAAVREALVTLEKVFKIRNCRDSYFNARSRPCLQYQIKRCTAPCVGYISATEYKQSVYAAKLFLEGKSQQILDDLAIRLQQAVAELHFEEAAALRDQMKHLRLVQEQQGVTQLRGEADVLAIEARPGFACIQCVTIRGGQVVGSAHFFPSMPPASAEDIFGGSLWQQAFEAFIYFYYVGMPQRIPPLIITNQPVLEKQNLEHLLQELCGLGCTIQERPRGKNARWMDFALNNLRIAVTAYENKQATINARFEALQTVLGLTNTIHRMECFDISHTDGQATVASCVVFDSKGPCNSAYRRFNITDITPGDDYAAMRAALKRRFKDKTAVDSFPDVLIIDGGKGQVSVVRSVLSELAIEGIYLLGIAKGPGRKAGLEKLILSAKDIECMLPPDSKALHLLQHIRDEAHRFAITAHRKKRQKASLQSSLESIEGVGPKRRQALLHRFGGIRELAKAPLEEIAKVAGMSQILAQRVFDYFHV